jgi:hypothetical protein
MEYTLLSSSSGKEIDFCMENLCSYVTLILVLHVRQHFQDQGAFNRSYSVSYNRMFKVVFHGFRPKCCCTLARLVLVKILLK